MSPKHLALAVPVLVCLAACVTTSTGDDRSLAERYNRPEAPDLAADPQVFVDLGKRIDEWVRLVHQSKSPAEIATLEKLESYLRQVATTEFELFFSAANSSIDLQRRPSLVVLGFSGREEAFDPLLNALRAEEPTVVDAAALGLAVLADPRTPPAALGTLMRDPERDDASRQNAAWALYMVQREAVPADQPKFLDEWRRNFGERIDAQPAMVMVQTLRGVGFAGDASLVGQVLPFVGHPTPRVRMAAALALGLLGDRAAVPDLIRLLEPQETNENVRLVARKALQRLAGGVDRGYDVTEWRRTFDLSNG